MQLRADELHIPREMSVAFTGHRSAGLPWGSNEADARCCSIKKQLSETIMKLYNQGKRYFISGMADGIDTYAAEIVLSLRKDYSEMKLICVYPFPSATRPSNRFAELADYSITICPRYMSGCMKIRNQYMVNHASELIACYDFRGTGGTLLTVRLALEAGIHVTFLPIPL